MYTGSGDIDSFGWNCGSTGWIELDFRSLNQITIIATTASAIAIMEAITMPTIAPTDKALLSAISAGPNAGGSLDQPQGYFKTGRDYSRHHTFRWVHFACV